MVCVAFTEQTLKYLNSLFENDMIAEEEYNSKRAEIISKL